MTSGQFQSFPVESIYVDRSERQRRELKNIDSLAHSIRMVGLINPPVVERDGKLRAGERRWTAIKALGWSHVPVQFVDELDEAHLQLLELEENLRRENLSWQDECAAVLKYHRMQEGLQDEWTQTKTADALGLTIATVSERLSVAKEIEGGNTRVSEAPKFSTAKGITARSAERKKTSALEGLRTGDGSEGLSLSAARSAPLLNADFIEWAAAYTGPRKFNFIHCDFPYGVNADKADQGQAATFGGYADSLDVYINLLNALSEAMDNVINDNAHLMFWFSMDYYAMTKDRLESMGWRINAFPLIWVKDDNTGILPDPSRGPRRIYETAFYGSRGDRKIVRAKSNAFNWPGKDKSIHMSEKPAPMLRHFFEMFVDEYSNVLDPTAGSANSLKAASALKAASVLGLELNTEFFNRALEAYFDDEP